MDFSQNIYFELNMVGSRHTQEIEVEGSQVLRLAWYKQQTLSQKQKQKNLKIWLCIYLQMNQVQVQSRKVKRCWKPNLSPPLKMLITAEPPLQPSPKSLILADIPIQNQKSEDQEESSYASIHSSHQIKN